MSTQNYSDKDMITDVLSTHKFVTDGYNTLANEAADPTVRNTFMSLLDEEHQIQHSVFTEMSKRGWYPTECAPQDKINTVKQKFAPDCRSCQSG